MYSADKAQADRDAIAAATHLIEQKSWYIRTALDRGISETADKVLDLASMCSHAVNSKDDFPLTPYLSLYNFAYYELQWLDETLNYLADLPEPIRPTYCREYDQSLIRKKMTDARTLLDSLRENFR